MTAIILEVALTAMCTALGCATIYILKGFSKRIDTTTEDLYDLKAKHSALEQRVTDNEKTIHHLNSDIARLEKDNKDLLAQINENFQKLQVSIEELKLRNAELTMQFKQADITHTDIKRDISLIASHLYGSNGTKEIQ